MAKLQPWHRAPRWPLEIVWTAVGISDLEARVLALICWRGEDDPGNAAIEIELALYCADFLGVDEDSAHDAICRLIDAGALPAALNDGGELALAALRDQAIAFVFSDSMLERVRKFTRPFPLDTTRAILKAVFLAEARFGDHLASDSLE